MIPTGISVLACSFVEVAARASFSRRARVTLKKWDAIISDLHALDDVKRYLAGSVARLAHAARRQHLSTTLRPPARAVANLLIREAVAVPVAPA